MPESHQLIIKKPVSALNSALNVDTRAFFTSLSKSLVAGIWGEPSTSTEYGIDALKEIGFKSKPEHIAWQLVISSFFNSFIKVAEKLKDLLVKEVSDSEITDLAQRVDHLLTHVEVTLDADFFEHPKELNLFEEFKPALTLWLKAMGMNDSQADSFQYQLREKFVHTLNETWSNEPERYKNVIDAVITPFTTASRDQAAWNSYSLWVKEKAHERVFKEAFSLKQVYIPLRAYYEETDEDAENKSQNKIVCDLHKTMQKWVLQFDKSDSLKVISGGPGSGKSSFAKVFAAEIIEVQNAPVLFIPLHQFNLLDDLIDSVGKFIRDEPHLLVNPLLKETREPRLIMIFDGLDELSEQGPAAREVTVLFIEKLTDMLNRLNSTGSKLQAIVTGRDLSIQQNTFNLQSNGSTLQILPYRMKDEESKEFKDPDHLLKEDQCIMWWQKFGRATGKNYDGIPTAVDTDQLFPLTKEPLLNYILSIRHEDQNTTFNSDTDLNNIYYELLNAVYERSYSGSNHSSANRQLSFVNFLEVLEEIAHVAWHNNGRTALEDDILKQCEESKVLPHLNKFSKNAKQGITRALTTFYFREFEAKAQQNRTFEFTHKSFADYLTARRLIKTIDHICEAVDRNKETGQSGITIAQALERWASNIGSSPVDGQLYDFVLNEILGRDISYLKKRQTTIFELFEVALSHDYPLVESENKSFGGTLLKHCRAEFSLLSLHAAFATHTRTLSKIKSDIFTLWLRRITGYYHNSVRYLSWLNCSDRIIFSTELQHACLDSCNFTDSNLTRCNLSMASLCQTKLVRARLSEVTFMNSNLTGAQLEEANLKNAILNEANFNGANLNGANLSQTNGGLAVFTDSSIKDANISNARFEGALFNNCDLSSTDLTKSNLMMAEFVDSKLTEATLFKANLALTNFTGANLSGANLIGADLTGANFTGANLTGANFSNATLLAVKWQGADLSGVIGWHNNPSRLG